MIEAGAMRASCAPRPRPRLRATRTHGRALRFSMRPTCLVAFVACLVVGARSQSAGCGKESPQLPGTSASFWVEWDGAWYEHWLTIPLTYEVRARFEGPHPGEQRDGTRRSLCASSTCELVRPLTSPPHAE